MAMTHDYMDYLNEKVDICPAGSEEELRAANTIADLMKQHAVEPQIEEFDAKTLGSVLPPAFFIAMFVGIVLAGVGLPLLTALGFVLVVGPTVLFVLKWLGNDVMSLLGPTTRSQNVVSFHKGTGPMVQKGTRPIVIVAHYDSPHENPLLSSPLAPYVPALWRSAKVCVPLAALCAVFQVLVFLPEAFRRFVWIIGILACLPLAILGVAAVIEHFSNSSIGANDNNSGVAALLGVLENVRPSGLTSVFDSESIEDVVEAMRRGGVPVSTVPAPEGDQPPEPAPAPAAPAVEPVGPRRGAEVLRSLGMLPEDCEIEYVDADLEPEEEPDGFDLIGQNLEEDGEDAASEPAAAQADEPADEDAPQPTDAEYDPAADLDEPNDPEVPLDEPEGFEGEELLPTDATPTAADLPEMPTQEEIVAGEPDLDEPDFVEEPTTASYRPLTAENFDEAADGSTVDPDHTGLTAEVFDPDATEAAAPAPKPADPEDPEWGQSSFVPDVSNVARRATLFDLPDPDEVNDPFATDPSARKVTSGQVSLPGVSSYSQTTRPSDSGVITRTGEYPVIHGSADADYEPVDDDSQEEGLLDRFKGFFAKKHSDDSHDGHGASWKGGAAVRSGLRVVQGGASEAAPSADDQRDAILGMNDDALVCHDIWFVALGASDCDHAGMRAFLAEHRKQIRGAFVINLDSIAAGELTILADEGLLVTRHADRRLTRLFKSVADDLHIPLSQRSYSWSSTDATPSMMSSMRSITVMGTGDAGMRALSRTPEDLPENLVPAQAVAVTEAVTELIRRS